MMLTQILCSAIIRESEIVWELSAHLEFWYEDFYQEDAWLSKKKSDYELVWLKKFRTHSHMHAVRYLPPRDFSDTLFFINIKMGLYNATVPQNNKYMNA